MWCVIPPTFLLTGEDAMTGDTDKYLGPQDLKELGDDSLPAEGYMGFSLGARSARYSSCSLPGYFTGPTWCKFFFLICSIATFLCFQKLNEVP